MAVAPPYYSENGADLNFAKQGGNTLGATLDLGTNDAENVTISVDGALVVTFEDGTLNVRFEGDLGINVDPTEKLHIDEDADAAVRVFIVNEDPGTGANVAVAFGTNATGVVAGALFQGSEAYAPYAGNGSLNLVNIKARPLALGTNNTIKVTIDTTGAVGIGSAVAPTANGSKVLYFGDNTADPTMGANTAGVYGKDVAGTVELFGVDEAGNVSQLTSHPADAPDTLYVSEDQTPPRIETTFFDLLGKVVYERNFPSVKVTETYTERNARLGFKEGDSGFKIKATEAEWDKRQSDCKVAIETQHAAWASSKSVDRGPEPQKTYTIKPLPTHMKRYM